MENLAADSAFFITGVTEAVWANGDRVSVRIMNFDSVIGVNIAPALVANLIIVNAGRADVDFIAIMVDSSAHFVDKVVVAAAGADCVIVFEAGGTDAHGFTNKSNVVNVVILAAVIALSIAVLQAGVADVDKLAVTVVNLGVFATMISATITDFVFGIASVAVESFFNFFAALDAKSVSADVERAIVVFVILPDRNFGAVSEFEPICVAAEAITPVDINLELVAPVVARNSEIWSVFEVGNFALNQIAIEAPFFSIAINAAITVAAFRGVHAGLKENAVVGFIGKNLA